MGWEDKIKEMESSLQVDIASSAIDKVRRKENKGK